jgi:putative Holliday junction resolvase
MTPGLPATALAGRALGLDLGTKRIGVAVSDDRRVLATSLEVVPRSGSLDSDHRRLRRVLDEVGATVVVVGLPLSLSGRAGPAASGVLDEVPALEKALGVPVVTVDERLTTVTAHQALAASGRRARARRPVVDQVAASMILQSWLDRQAFGEAAGE